MSGEGEGGGGGGGGLVMSNASSLERLSLDFNRVN